MVSEHDEALLKRFYEAINDENVDAVMDLCAKEVEVYMPPEVVSAVAPRGHRDVGSYLRQFMDSWHMYRPEPEDFIEAGDEVVALVHLRARGKGSRFEIDEEIADVFRVDDGKISRMRLYVHREQALPRASSN